MLSPCYIYIYILCTGCSPIQLVGAFSCNLNDYLLRHSLHGGILEMLKVYIHICVYSIANTLNYIHEWLGSQERPFLASFKKQMVLESGAQKCFQDHSIAVGVAAGH